MDRVYQANVSETPTPLPSPGSSGFVQGEVPLRYMNPTSPDAHFFFHVTESFRYVIVQAGLTPDPTNLHQLRDAVLILAGL